MAEVAGVTRDSDTTFKVKRSKVNLQGRGHIVGPPAQLVTIKLYIIVNGIRAYKSQSSTYVSYPIQYELTVI